MLHVKPHKHIGKEACYQPLGRQLVANHMWLMNDFFIS